MLHPVSVMVGMLGVGGACVGGKFQCFPTSFVQARIFDSAGGVV